MVTEELPLRRRRLLTAGLHLQLGLIAFCAAAGPGGLVPGRPGQLAVAAVGSLAFAVAALLATLRGLWVRDGRLAGLAIGAGLAAWVPAYAMYAFDAQPWAGQPMASDVLWLAGYLGFYAAILHQGKARVVRSAGVWLDGLAGSLALGAVAVAVLVPLVRAEVEGDHVPVAVALAYPLADALLLTFVVALSAMAGWRPGRAFVAMAAAMALLVVSDLPYVLAIAGGDFEPGGLGDVAWMVAVTAMAAATWQRPSAHAPAVAAVPVALVFPALSGILSTAILAGGAIRGVPLPAVVLATLALAASLLRLLLSYRELHELVESRRVSLTDDLTGLGNRRRLMGDLHAALAGPADGGVALVVLDLDGFKELNDALGHPAGDEVLRTVGRRLCAASRPGDVATRLGGDEFAVLLHDVGDHAEAAAHRLAAAVAEPVSVEGVTLRVHASAGVVSSPGDGQEAELLLRRADLALQRAKARPGAVCVYEDGLDAGALERLRLAADLERALDAGELVLHYQPLADARTGAIVSVEGLVRWQHPERGLLFPDAFLPALERTTLTSRFTRVVLQAAIAQAVAFRAAGRPLRVAANLMPSDLLDDGLPAEVARLLVTHGARPADIVLEVTETGVLSDVDRAHDVLERLRDLGVRVALDDFGTGHSSLTHLQRLPADLLKIDRSFVADVAHVPATAAIVRSMVELAHQLGQHVVAEGVEDAELWRRLGGWGCDFVQGWALGKAMPAEELLEQLDDLTERGRLAAGRPLLSALA